MEVIKNGLAPKEDASHSPIFYGGKVSLQPIVGAERSAYYNFTQVNFSAGAKNKFHPHTSDQILFVTGGKGYVASDSAKIEVAPGDTAFIPAGEKHWHGATENSDFSHISLTTPDSQTQIFD